VIPNVQLSAEARTDIREIARFVARDSRDAGLRFGASVEKTLRGLSAFPGKGSPKEFDSSRLRDVRSYAVDGFPNHLILYQIQPEGSIHVLAVSHGARNLIRMLRKRR
jgi:plasmid stabilization system protein ParE